jgi:Family of unknown function (DUF6526)
MSQPEAQDVSNHARFVPLYHFVASLLLLVNLVWGCVRIYHLRDAGRFALANAGVELLVAVALVIIWAYMRIFPLAVQDRVIRLEMRLRLAEALPADLRPRVVELTPQQLIALRFASDAELPELVRAVLEGRLRRQAEIKGQIRSWQADHLRA